MLDGLNPLNCSEAAAVARLLIEAGANVNAGGQSWFPLLFHCDTGNEQIVRLLLKNGADPNQAFSRRNDPQIDHGTTALMVAAGHGNRRTWPRYLKAVKLLLAAGARISDLDESGHNALFYALYWDKPAAAKELLKRGSELTDDALGGRYSTAMSNSYVYSSRAEPTSTACCMRSTRAANSLKARRYWDAHSLGQGRPVILWKSSGC
jgi:ankyrin repeat protein